MKAGLATHPTTTTTKSRTGAEQPEGTKGETFATSLAKSLAPVFDTVVHVEVELGPRESGGRGTPTDRTSKNTPAERTIVREDADTAQADAETSDTEADGSDSAGQGVEAEPTAALEGNRVLGPALTVVEHADAAQESSVKPAAAPKSEAVDADGSTTGTLGDADPEQEKVRVARDPLGLMPQQEAATGAAADRPSRENEPSLAQMQDQRRVDARAQTAGSPTSSGPQNPNHTGNQTTGSVTTATAAAGAAMPVSGATPTTASAFARPGGASAPGGAAGLAGLTGVGRNGVWKLESTSKPQLAAARANPESQVARAMVAALRHKGGVVTLRLSPDDLGQVRVELRVDDGRVSATIDAQDERARGALQGGIETLRKSLEASGLTVDRLEVVGATQTAAHLAVDLGKAYEQGDAQSPRDYQEQEQPQHGAWQRGGDDGPSGQGGRESALDHEVDNAPEAGSVDLAWSLRTLRLDTVV